MTVGLVGLRVFAFADDGADSQLCVTPAHAAGRAVWCTMPVVATVDAIIVASNAPRQIPETHQRRMIMSGCCFRPKRGQLSSQGRYPPTLRRVADKTIIFSSRREEKMFCRHMANEQLACDLAFDRALAALVRPRFLFSVCWFFVTSTIACEEVAAVPLFLVAAPLMPDVVTSTGTKRAFSAVAAATAAAAAMVSSSSSSSSSAAAASSSSIAAPTVTGEPLRARFVQRAVVSRNRPSLATRSRGWPRAGAAIVPAGFNRVCFDYSEKRDGSKLQPLNDYLRFLGRVYAQAAVSTFDGLTTHFKSAAWTDILEPFSDQNLSHLLSNLMAESVNCNTVQNNIPITRIQLADDERCNALGAFLNYQSRSLAATTWMFWTRAQHAAFKRFLTARLEREFPGRRFQADTVARLVAAVFDCSFQFGNESETFHLLLRSVIKDQLPESVNSANDSSFVLRFLSRKHKTIQLADNIRSARDQLDVAAFGRFEKIQIAPPTRDRLVERLGAFNAYVVGIALTAPIRHRLVGSGPLALLAPARTGAQAPFVGDIDLAVDFSPNETPDQREKRRAASKTFWTKVINELLEKNNQLKVNVRNSDTCLHFDVIWKADQTLVAKFDVCDALEGPKSLPLAPSLNLALSFDASSDSGFALELYRNDPFERDDVAALLRARDHAAAGRVSLRRYSFIRETVDAAEAAYMQRAVAYGRRWQVFEDRRRVEGETAVTMTSLDFFLPPCRVRAQSGRLLLEASPPGFTAKAWKDLIGVDLRVLAKALVRARDDVLQNSRAADTDAARTADAAKAMAEANAAFLAKQIERAALRREAAQHAVAVTDAVPVAVTHVSVTATTMDVDDNDESQPEPATVVVSTPWLDLDADDIAIDVGDGDGDDYADATPAPRWTNLDKLSFCLGFAAPFGRGLRSAYLCDGRVAVRALAFMQSELGEDLQRKRGKAISSVTRLLPQLSSSTFRSYVLPKAIFDKSNLFGCHGHGKLPHGRLVVVNGDKIVERLAWGIGAKTPRQQFDRILELSQAIPRGKSVDGSECLDPLYGFWRGKAKALRVCADGLRFLVDPRIEARERRSAATTNAKMRLDRLKELGAQMVKSVPAIKLEFDGDVRRAEETMDNGGLLQKWRDCQKILTNRGAAEVENRAAARASRAAPLPPQLPPPRQSDLASSFGKPPTGAVDVFKKIAKAPSASDAFDFLLSASPPRACVYLDRGFTSKDAVIETDALKETVDVKDSFTNNGSTDKAVRCGKSSILYVRRKLLREHDEHTALVFVDGGKAGGFVLVNDSGADIFSINIDKFSRRFLMSDDRQHGDRGARERGALARRKQYDEALLDLLARRAAHKHRTIVILGRNWTLGWQQITFELLQRDVGVLLLEESGTSKNCSCCLKELRSVKGSVIKFVCKKALEAVRELDKLKPVAIAATEITHHGGGGDDDDESEAQHSKKKLRLSEKPAATPAARDKPAAFPPLDTSLAQSIESMQTQRCDNTLELPTADDGEHEKTARCGLTAREVDSCAQQTQLGRTHTDSTKGRIAGVTSTAVTKLQLTKLQTLLMMPKDDVFVSKRRRLLVMLAVAHDKLRLDDAETVARANESDERVKELEKIKLPSSHDGLGVIQTLARVTAPSLQSLVGNKSTVVKPQPTRRLGVMDAIAAVRGRQFWQVMSHMSTSKLERKWERVVTRARCDQCKSTRQRCQECLGARLAASAKLSCVGSGHCACTAQSKVDAKNTARVEHKYDMWRLRSCQHQHQQQQQQSSSEQQQPLGPKNNTSHIVQRDLNATLAFSAILVVDNACAGRSRSFCRSQCPLSSRAGSKDTIHFSPEK
jgi:hypothetical protein